MRASQSVVALTGIYPTGIYPTGIYSVHASNRSAVLSIGDVSAFMNRYPIHCHRSDRARRCAARRLAITILPLLLCIAIRATGQPGMFKFETISTDDGLSDNYVLCTLQDRFGFLWFGTRDGLNRYDGQRFIIYKNNIHDPGSLSPGGVDHMLEDRNGWLWIGTSAGLDLYDRFTGRFLHFRHDPDDPTTICGNRIIALREGTNGDIWVATSDGAEARVARYDRRRRRFVRYRHDSTNPFSLSDNDASSIAVDRNGTIWIGTVKGGLNRYDPGRDGFINHRTDPTYIEASTPSVTMLGIDARGALWCRTTVRDLQRIYVRNGSLVRDSESLFSTPSLVNAYPFSFTTDTFGNMWIGTMRGGAVVFNPETRRLTQFVHASTDPHSLSSNHVFSVTCDRAGNVWIGTDNGASKFSRQAWHFRQYSYDPIDAAGLSHPRVRSVMKDRAGDLWVGTGGGGLNRLRSGATRFEHLLATTDMERIGGGDIVNTIMQDSRGDIWYGTNHALVQLDPRTGARRLYRHNPLDSTTIGKSGIWTIVEDGDSVLWVGALQSGISRLDRRTGKFRRYVNHPNDPHSLSDNHVHMIFKDRSGTIWVGTDGGLNRFDRATGRFIHHRNRTGDSTSLSNDRVWFIHESRDGTLWIGTSGGGVNRMARGESRFTRYTEDQGLTHNMVCGIVEDSRGQIWISTNNGISRLDPRTGAMSNFSVGDGLTVREFHFKACYRGDDNTIFFGGNGGVVFFNPDSISVNRSIPQIALTSFKLFDKQIALDTLLDLKRSIHLRHDENFFAFEFASLDYTNPERNQYLYRLEGFDKDWRVARGRGSQASYTNVPPGVYTFRVLGSNNDNIWNDDTGRAIDVVIEPAYWQTSWFRATSVLLLVSGIGAVVALRFRAVRRKGELERKIVVSQLRALQAQMNPHFIFNSLNAILHFIMTHDSESAHKYLSKFSKLMRAILDASRRDTSPLSSELDALRLYLDLEALRHDHLFEYVIEVDPAIDIDSVEIPPMIIQPYVENAINHGLRYRREKGLLTIRLREGERSIICSVVDNGVGRERSREIKALYPSAFKSVGMQVTQERLEILSMMHRNRFSVEVLDLHDNNNTPLGTQVDIRIPVN